MPIVAGNRLRTTLLGRWYALGNSQLYLAIDAINQDPEMLQMFGDYRWVETAARMTLIFSCSLDELSGKCLNIDPFATPKCYRFFSVRSILVSSLELITSVVTRDDSLFPSILSCAMSRTSPRPVNTVFAIMNLFDVNLEDQFKMSSLVWHMLAL